MTRRLQRKTTEIRSPYADDWASQAAALEREIAAIEAAHVAASPARQQRLANITAGYKGLLADKKMLGNLPPHYRPLVEPGWSQKAKNDCAASIAARLGSGIPKQRYGAYRFHIERALREMGTPEQSAKKVLRRLVRAAVVAAVQQATQPQARITVGAGHSRRVFALGRGGGPIRPLYDLPREVLDQWLLARIRDDVMESLLDAGWRRLPTGTKPRAPGRPSGPRSTLSIPPNLVRHLWPLLTPRERQVLKETARPHGRSNTLLLAAPKPVQSSVRRGHKGGETVVLKAETRRTSDEIGSALGISGSAIRFHLSNIRKKARRLTQAPVGSALKGGPPPRESEEDRG